MGYLDRVLISEDNESITISESHINGPIGIRTWKEWWDGVSCEEVEKRVNREINQRLWSKNSQRPYFTPRAVCISPEEAFRACDESSNKEN